MQHFAHREDCEVHRDMEQYPGMVVMMDCDGHAILIMDKKYTDKEMWTFFNMANHFYNKGYQHGQSAKAREIKKVLEIEL